MNMAVMSYGIWPAGSTHRRNCVYLRIYQVLQRLGHSLEGGTCFCMGSDEDRRDHLSVNTFGSSGLAYTPN